LGAVGRIFEAEKGKCMKWFWRYVWRKMQLIGNETQEIDCDLPISATKAGRLVAREHDWHENLNVMITNANGGKIVTFRRYDHKTDRHDNRIYVIPDDNDFNVELGKLITLESMRG
jgi:hypothetical protein